LRGIVSQLLQLSPGSHQPLGLINVFPLDYSALIQLASYTLGRISGGFGRWPFPLLEQKTHTRKRSLPHKRKSVKT